MKKKYSLVGLMLLLLWVPLSVLAQDATLKDAKKLFEDNKIQESAQIFLKLANEDKDPEASYYLGRIFNEGLGGIQPQRRLGFEYYKKAAEKNHIEAQTEYGIYYLSGEFVLRDYKKAIQFFEKSAAKNNLKALLILGGLYSSGTVVKKNNKKAFQNYEKAAKAGSEVAAYQIGTFYEEGKSVSKSDKKAYDWYRKSADKKFVPSLLKLAEYFRDGKAVKKNLVNAYAYFNLASSLGSNQAKQELATIEKEFTLKEIQQAQETSKKLQKNPGTNLK